MPCGSIFIISLYLIYSPRYAIRRHILPGQLSADVSSSGQAMSLRDHSGGLFLYLRRPVERHVDKRWRRYRCDYQKPLTVAGHNKTVSAFFENELCLEQKFWRLRLECAGAGFDLGGYQLTILISIEQLLPISPPLRL